MIFVLLRYEKLKYSYLHSTDMEIESILILLNDWWKSGQVSSDLAKKYRRKIITEFKRVFNKRHEILLLTGLRRVGKTTIIYQQIEDLLKEVAPESILYFTFDYGQIDLFELLDAYSKITGTDWKHRKIFVFLDEIQKLSGWSSKIKILFDAFPNVRITLSGSASLQLEKDAIDDLAGRYFTIDVKPLSLIEFYELKHSEQITNPVLYKSELNAEETSYIERPFPAIVDWKEYRDVSTYIRENVLSKIIRGDLQDTFKDINIALLERMIDTFYANPGMIMNVDESVHNFGVSKTTFERHIFFLEFAKLIRICANFRGSHMAISRKNKKIYPYDISLALSFNPNIDIGKVLETKTASIIDAKMYWRDGQNEVDFVTLNGRKLLGIEVKAAKDVDLRTLSSLDKFSRKFSAEKFIVYRGEDKKIKYTNCVSVTTLLIKDGLM